MTTQVANNEVNVKCTGCNNSFSIMSTMKTNLFNVEYCNQCHPAYTGATQKIADGAREKFEQKYKDFKDIFG